MTGFVFYKGPSLIDGKPIVAILTIESRNRKTGDMGQTWIMRDRISPLKAVANGGDLSVCGLCYHRGWGDRPRTCYLNMGQAPEAVWHAYKRGVYDVVPDLRAAVTWANLRKLRNGSYGEPPSIPLKVWKPAFQELDVMSGYTHLWRTCDPEWADYLMASCDSTDELREAEGEGWRGFLAARHDQEALLLDTRRALVRCPENQGTKCADCGLCDGVLAKPNGPHVWIPAHGSAKRFVGE